MSNDKRGQSQRRMTGHCRSQTRQFLSFPSSSPARTRTQHITARRSTRKHLGGVDGGGRGWAGVVRDQGEVGRRRDRRVGVGVLKHNADRI